MMSKLDFIIYVRYYLFSCCLPTGEEPESKVTVVCGRAQIKSLSCDPRPMFFPLEHVSSHHLGWS